MRRRRISDIARAAYAVAAVWSGRCGPCLEEAQGGRDGLLALGARFGVDDFHRDRCGCGGRDPEADGHREGCRFRRRSWPRRRGWRRPSALCAAPRGGRAELGGMDVNPADGPADAETGHEHPRPASRAADYESRALATACCDLHVGSSGQRGYSSSSSWPVGGENLLLRGQDVGSVVERRDVQPGGVAFKHPGDGVGCA